MAIYSLAPNRLEGNRLNNRATPLHFMHQERRLTLAAIAFAVLFGNGLIARPSIAQTTDPGASILEQRIVSLNLAGIGKAESGSTTTLTVPIVEAETDTFRRLAVSPRILSSQPALENAQLQRTSVQVVTLASGQRAVQITGDEAIAALSAITIELMWVGGGTQKEFALVPSLKAPELPALVMAPLEKPPEVIRSPELASPPQAVIEPLREPAPSPSLDPKTPAAVAAPLSTEPSAVALARSQKPVELGERKRTARRVAAMPFKTTRKQEIPSSSLVAKTDVLKLDPPTTKKQQLTESKIAKKASRTEENSRVKELQDQIAQLQLLVDLKNKAIAFNQQKLTQVNSLALSQTVPAQTLAVAKSQTIGLSPSLAPSTVAPSVAPNPTPQLAPAAPKLTQAQPAPTKESGFDLTALIVLGLLLLLLLGAIVMWMRRRKTKAKEQQANPETDTFANSSYFENSRTPLIRTP